MTTLKQLRERMISDSDFRDDYVGAETPVSARNLILNYAKDEGLDPNVQQREWLRRELNEYCLCTQKTSKFPVQGIDRISACDIVPNLVLSRYDNDDDARYPDPCSTNCKEPNVAIKFIETKTFINGIDAKSLTNDSIYGIIADRESRIKMLNGLENKPKAIVNEIADINGDIKALVAHLDSLIPATPAV